jgi:hypothetical protein
MRSAGLFILIAAIGVWLAGWNAARFVGAQARIRAKDLTFLPAPVVAKLLCLGHGNTVAKLRWIDSFAYFQYQLDHQDDRVAGGGTGFQRLYETLITLDPQFVPYYEHASLNTAGVLKEYDVALGFLLRGIAAMPGNRDLWRAAAAELKVHFHWEERTPWLMDGFLASWEAAEATPEGKRLVWDWKRSMGRRTFHGLEQVPYWHEQLLRSVPGSPSGDYIEAVLREQLAAFGIQELERLRDDWLAAHGAMPLHLAGLADLYRGAALATIAAARAEPPPMRCAALVDEALLAHRYPAGLPPLGPVLRNEQGVLHLRNDPFGLAWELVGGRVVSGGLERRAYDRTVANANAALLDAAKERGHWPSRLDEVAGFGIELPGPPSGGRLMLDGQTLRVAWDPPPTAPWTLR